MAKIFAPIRLETPTAKMSISEALLLGGITYYLISFHGGNLAKTIGGWWSSFTGGTGEAIGDYLVTDYAAIWQVNWKKYPRKLDSLRGSKQWGTTLPADIANTLSHGLSAPSALISQLVHPSSDLSRGQGGRLVPSNYHFENYLGKDQNLLVGDVRALYCMNLLFEATRDMEIPTSGAWVDVGSDPDKEYGHDYGYAMDLGTHQDGEAHADSLFYKMLAAAKSYQMPIGWISPKQIEQGSWPIYQLREGEEVEVGKTTSNHSVPYHYHIMFPRPNFALEFVSRDYL